MSLTRDQLRAARALLHLQQDVLADMARVGVATIRRFEGGRDISHLHIEALERAVVEAGAVLIDGMAGKVVGCGMTGVLLRPEGELPVGTRARIKAGRTYTRTTAGDEAKESGEELSADGARRDVGNPEPVTTGRKGRPKGTTRRARPSGTTD